MVEREKVSILLVDDLPEKLLVYRTILEELGEEIVSAGSGQEALKQILQKNFAVILLDVNMPGMDGFETAMLIRKRAKSAHTPIIFITSFYDDLRPHRGYAHGAVDYILAPVEPEILKAKVKVFIDLCRLNRQVERRAEERINLAEEKAKRIAAEHANRNSAFLAQASRVLAHSLDLEDTLQGLEQLAVPFIADLSVICLLEEGQKTIRTEWVHRDAEGIVCNQSTQSAPPMPDRIAKAVERVLVTGEKEIFPLLEPDTEVKILSAKYSPFGEFTWHSVVILPLSVREKLLGCILLAQGNSDRAYHANELALAEDLAHRGAIALDNAILVKNIREADKRKDEFLAMLAHELRNPLAPIQNAVEILRLADSMDHRVLRAREMIDRQTRHLTRLVDDLLDVSRITRGKIRLQMEVFDLSMALLGAAEASRPLIEARRHHFTVNLPAEPIQIKADPARIIQVIANLLNNAAKYSPDQETICLSAERDENEAVIRVRDSGEGIPPEMLTSIFEPFIQVHTTSERAHGGLGIGLTLVRRLVELHEGSVIAQSQGRGKGSEFIVRLPSIVPATPEIEDQFDVHNSTSPISQKRIVAVTEANPIAECVSK